MPTWDSVAADDLWTEACGKERWRRPTKSLEQDVRGVSDAELWRFRAAARESLVEIARDRWSGPLTAAGATREEVVGAKHLFDPNTLTLGFARRFATYKRPDLMLHDPARFLQLLANRERLRASRRRPTSRPRESSRSR